MESFASGGARRYKYPRGSNLYEDDSVFILRYNQDDLWDSSRFTTLLSLSLIKSSRILHGLEDLRIFISQECQIIHESKVKLLLLRTESRKFIERGSFSRSLNLST